MSNTINQPSLFDVDDNSNVQDVCVGTAKNISTGLQPIIKWPGGKEKELKYILPNIPPFRRFFEPFVGGGSVFMAIDADSYYINDFSSELIDFYTCIETENVAFYEYATLMDKSWENTRIFCQSNTILVDRYLDFRNGVISKKELQNIINQFCNSNKEQIRSIIPSKLGLKYEVLHKEMQTNLFRKMTRMSVLEQERHQLPEQDIYDNIETAIKSAVYMYYRNMYNDKELGVNDPVLHCALFFFMRNYAYSGMFRYSSKGEFNVPYGGMAYNSKMMNKKLSYYKSAKLLEHFKKTKIYNFDFEEFLRNAAPDKDDFVFLDPPYDSEFSTYAQNAFTKDDQKRLATFMINECKAKWMMIIKNTDFIYDLYNKPGISIRTFDKEYLVSFMNRNNKKVTHLLITNY